MRWIPLLLLFATAPGFAEDETVLLQDSRKRFSIRIPGTWRAKEIAAKDTHASFDIDLPGSDRRVRLNIELFRGNEDPRGQPEAYRRQMATKDSVRDFRIESKRLPHIVFRRMGDDSWERMVQTFVRDRGRTLSPQFIAEPEIVTEAYDSFLQCALTAKVALAPFPEVPSGYTVTAKQGLRYATHPGVKAPTKHMLAVMQAVRKRFEKFHGKLPAVPKGSPEPVIYIHAERLDAKALASFLEQSNRAFDFDATTLRFFATPVQKDDPQGTGDLVSEFTQFLLWRRYGTSVPRWAFVGELNSARAENDTGKKLPWVTAGHRGWSDGLELPSLDGYAADSEADSSAAKKCFFYVLFFRCGGSKYKKAYRALLDDVASHYDRKAAAKRHLEPLDYEKLKARAAKFMRGGLKYTKG